MRDTDVRMQCPCGATCVADTVRYLELFRCPRCREVSFADVNRGAWVLRPATEIKFENMLVRHKESADYYPEEHDAPSYARPARDGHTDG